jgi:hypothetical protein
MIPTSPSRRARWGALAGLLLSAAAVAQAPPRDPRPLALHRVSIEGKAGAWTVLVREGRVERVQPASEDVSPAYRVVEGEGLVAAPAFLDAAAAAGLAEWTVEVDQDRPVDTGAGVRIAMRQANRKGLRPSWRAADHLSLAKDDAEKWAQAGFGAMAATPSGALLAGSSCLVVPRDLAARELVLAADLMQHAAFRAPGGGYPSTLMGYLAHLRQFFLDAQHHRELVRRARAGAAVPRPAHDPDLEAAWPLLDGLTHLACEAESARDIHRWLDLAEEFGLKVAIVGGREAWKAADRLKATGTPVVLTLDWSEEAKDPREAEEDKGSKRGKRGRRGDAPEEDTEEDTEEDDAEGEANEGAPADEPTAPAMDWSYEEPLGVRLDKRLRWEEQRDCAARLHEAGVTVAFGSGDGGAGRLVERLTEAVEAGLPRTAALAGLSSSGAALLGVESLVGRLEPGAPASLCLWTAEPLTEDAKVRYAILEGHLHEFEAKVDGGDPPAEGVDLTGTWTLTDPGSPDDDPMTLTLRMDEEGAVTGDAAAVNPMDGSALTGAVKGRVSGTTVRLETSFTVGPMTVAVEMEGAWKDGAFTGTTTIDLGGQQEESKFEAAKTPDRSQR